MKLCYDKRAKDPTYFIQKGIRNGKKTTTVNVYRIGKHSELLAITPDPLAYAKQKVEEANRKIKEGEVEINYKVDFNKSLYIKGVVSKSQSVNVGYFILQKIYHDLEIKDFFKEIQEDSKVKFNCNDINRFLTFSRILEPRSKLGTYDRLDMYYEHPSFGYHQILRFLDVLSNHYEDYIQHLYVNSTAVVKRNTAVCYFDCTNYYFETEQEDDDYVDEVTGESIKGLRKYGKSKENRPNPIVQMGLFTDGDGIPLSMCINPGSDNEQLCAVPTEKMITKMFKGSPFIYCADSGLGSYNVRQYNSMGGRAFVVTQSIKKLSNALKDAVFDDYDYRLLSDNTPISIQYMKEFDHKDNANRKLYDDKAYKIITADKAVDLGLYEEKKCKNGHVRMVKSHGILEQKVIVTFSRKLMEYERNVRNAQIERAKKLLASNNPEDIKKGPNDVKRFIKRTSKGSDGRKATDKYSLDKELIAREEQYDGFYAVATNLDDDAKTVLGINDQRYLIEECFEVLKTNFSARPTYHRNSNRIVAHFMICYTALLIFRILQKKLDDYGTHFTTNDILETLKNMNVKNVHDIYYDADFTGSEVGAALNGIFRLGLDKESYLPKELNKKIRQIS